jgi:hypothetical protein
MIRQILCFAALAALPLALAGCGPSPDRGAEAPPAPGDTDVPEGNVARETPPAPAASSPAQPSAPPAPALPARFLGAWDRSAAACAGRGSEMRLVVEPGRLRFHESVARVEAVRETGNGVVEADLAFQGEGESWSETRSLRLLADDRLAVEAAGPPAERVRCG